MLDYERIGGEKTVPVYRRPERDEAETDDDFARRLAEWEPKAGIQITVAKVTRPLAREWGFALSAAQSLNAKLAKAEGADLGAEVIVTREGMEAILAVHRKYLVQALRGVSGFAIGGEDVSTLTTPEAMVQALEDTDHLPFAGAAARARQDPTPTQRN